MSTCHVIKFCNIKIYVVVDYRDPTPNITRNVTWEPYNQYNYTYLIINWHSYLWFRYRQSQYGFWNEYFPTMARQNYCKQYHLNS